jgi:hypothetical protein
MPALSINKDVDSRLRLGAEIVSPHRLSPSAGATGKASVEADEEAFLNRKSYLERGIVTPRRTPLILFNTCSNQTIRRILEVVEQSKSILDLEEDWDGEGSSAYNAATWQKAVDFLVRNALHVWQSQQLRLEAPRISPGPDGSIDLHWKTSQRELLINIPAEEDQLASFYGDNKAGQIVKGFLHISKGNQWLLMW